MKMLARRFQTEWPAWLAISFVALLPLRRSAEIPLAIFAVAFPVLLRSSEHRDTVKSLLPLLLPLFLCFWIPMLLSSFDSYDPLKSWTSSLAAVRYLLAALSIGVLIRASSLRWLVLRGVSYLLIFWALDGYIQLASGKDLFGITMHPDRLNALFFDKHQFYGPTLAMLSPLLFEYARRRCPAWVWGTCFVLILGAVMISGMRSGWLAIGLVGLTYFLIVLRKDKFELRRSTVIIPALALAVIMGSYLISPIVQERVSRTLTIAHGAESALDYATSWRLPIFKASIAMISAHPINGVGVRAFPQAYPNFAPPDDVHVVRLADGTGATHAHNLILEALADTGIIGLLGLIIGFTLAWRAWRAMRSGSRRESFPFLLALGLILFPLNSHFAIFGTYLSSLIWFLIGMWAAAWRR